MAELKLYSLKGTAILRREALGTHIHSDAGMLLDVSQAASLFVPVRGYKVVELTVILKENELYMILKL